MICSTDIDNHKEKGRLENLLTSSEKRDITITVTFFHCGSQMTVAIMQ